MALQLLFWCHGCCQSTGYEKPDEDIILQEIFGNEDREQHLPHNLHKQQDITRPFQDDFSGVAMPVLLGTQGMTGKRPVQVPKISDWEKVTNRDQDRTSNRGGCPSKELPLNEGARNQLLQQGTPTSSIPARARRLTFLLSPRPGSLSPGVSCRSRRSTFRFSPRLESLSPGGTCRSYCISDGGDFPITSYRIDMDEPERHLSRHVAFAPSRNHSVHISECSLTPYGEVYGQHPSSFHFDREGNRVACEPDFFHADEENLIMKPQLNFGPAGSICFDD